jgi:hypothetical protein
LEKIIEIRGNFAAVKGMAFQTQGNGWEKAWGWQKARSKLSTLL